MAAKEASESMNDSSSRRQQVNCDGPLEDERWLPDQQLTRTEQLQGKQAFSDWMYLERETSCNKETYSHS